MSFFASFWRQRNYRVATVVAALAVMWLLSGLLGSGDPRDPEPGAAAPVVAAGEAIRIQARRIEAQPYATRVLVNGHTEANRSVRLRAELDGAIVGLPVAEGRAVKKGEVICLIDPEDRPEQLDRARAALRKAELDYAGAQRLQKKGLQSDTAMAQQEVALAHARADYRRAEVAVDNLQIRAPFAGVVNSRAVELGDYIRRGEECATLLDLDPILVVGEVSESQVGNLMPGGPASAQLQQGQLVQGSLRYISQQAHEITRAYRVEVAVDNASGALRAGLSGRLALPTGEIMAHRINSSLLTLDDRGDLGVRILDAENRVHFANVQLVGDGESGIWVSGLPQQATLITVGQEYVTPGEIVQVELEQLESDLPAPSQHAEPPAAAVVPVAEQVASPREELVQ
ncbi:efflux RND transporter periplasmic adaptor subunit [Microbulbifer marinus]|uniref:Membrane fusion protein, multidrug efflux system n=1 Tax=Microbulbifer marinus TaxID=658218 RepID=A0A1H4ANI1_9GAMM|nr:efflux RND transporter periplasmic adaptor subunit [Microbulbifer marinus]SEA37519.1 membrane fusion protein, multidrug efflux system [Microbulbifer marinus]